MLSSLLHSDYAVDSISPRPDSGTPIPEPVSGMPRRESIERLPLPLPFPFEDGNPRYTIPYDMTTSSFPSPPIRLCKAPHEKRQLLPRIRAMRAARRPMLPHRRFRRAPD